MGAGVLIVTGKESTFTIGYGSDKTHKDNKYISLIFFEIFWNKKNKKFGLGIGIPFLAAIAIVFGDEF